MKLTLGRILVIIVVSGIAATLALAGIFIYSVYNLHSQRDIAVSVSVAGDWTVIPIEPALRIERQVQEVRLVVEGARNSAKTMKVILPDGSVFEPMIELEDQDGAWHRLGKGSIAVGGYDEATDTFAAKAVGFKLHDDELPRTMKFKSMRIRSDNPFTCSKIIWDVYDLK